MKFSDVLGRILVFLVIFSPLISSSEMLFGYTALRFVFVLFAVTLGIFGALVFVRKKKEVSVTLVDVALTGFFLTMLISLVGVPDVRASLWSETGRLSGVITYAAFGVWYLVLRFAAIDKKTWNLGAVCLLMVAIASSFFGFHDAVFGVSGERAAGLTGNALMFGNYLAPYFFVVFLLDDIVFFRKKIVQIISALIIFLGVYVTQTRSALLGIGIGAFIAAFWYVREQKIFQKIKKSYVIGGLFALVLCVGIFITANQNKFFGRDTLSTRLINWGIAVRAGIERPVFGWGWENYRGVVDAYFDASLASHSYYETRIDKPHNIPVEIFVSMGFVGLILYVLIIVSLIRGVLHAYRKNILSGAQSSALFGSIITIFVQGLFSFDTPLTLLLTIFICAFVANTQEENFLIKLPGFLLKIILFVGLLGGVYASFMGSASIRQLYYGFQSEEAAQAKDYARLHQIFVNSNAVEKGVFYFETWRWFVQSYTTDFAIGARSLNELTLEEQKIWKEDTDIIAQQTKEYLLKNGNSTEAQLFGGKAAYYLALAKQDSQYLLVARDAFLQAQKLSPLRQEAYMLISYVYAELKLGREAMAAYIQALDIGTTVEVVRARDVLIEKFVKSGDNDSIVLLLEELVRKSPNAELYARLAAAYAEKKDYVSARRAVLEAIAYDSSFATEAEKFLASFPPNK